MNAYFPCNICDLQVNKAPVIVDIYRYIFPVLPKNSWHTGIAKNNSWNKFHMKISLEFHFKFSQLFLCSRLHLQYTTNWEARFLQLTCEFMTRIVDEDELQLTLEFMTLDTFKDEHWVQQTRGDGDDVSGIVPTDEKSSAVIVCDGSCEVASQLDSSKHVILFQDSCQCSNSMWWILWSGKPTRLERARDCCRTAERNSDGV